jgi:hypothetical protein
MALSTILLAALIALLIALLISWSVLSTARPAALQSLEPSVGSLQKLTRIGSFRDARDNFLAPSGATLIVYVFCAGNSKTSSVIPNRTNIPILSIGNVMRLLILPGGASTPPQTQLTIRTQGTTTNAEVIDLAPLPQQQWVQIAIVREGRRYTVYYNGKVVASERTRDTPVINSSELTIGDPQLAGQFALPRIAPTPMRLEEIQYDLQQTSDSKHEPYIPTQFSFPAFFNLFGCPGGLFCFTTTTPPTGMPLKMWATPYD